MRPLTRLIPMIAALALVFTLGAALVPAASAQDAGSVTIHKAECPPGYQGTDFYNDCHANPLAGVAFTALGPEGYLVERTTGTDGTIVFGGITVGGNVTIVEHFPAGIAEFRVFCSLFDPNRPVDFTYADTVQGAGINVDVFGQDILCDWYNIPVAQQTLLDFTITKFNCPTDPGNVSVPAGNIPAECDRVAGIPFRVTGEDGTVLATCTTGTEGWCTVRLPEGATVTVTEQAAPAGYAPRENPITTRVLTEFAGALFINLPVADDGAPQPTPTPVPQQPGAPTVRLPSTGAGTTASETGFGSQLALLAALAAACAGAASPPIRRRAVASSGSWPGARRRR